VRNGGGAKRGFRKTSSHQPLTLLSLTVVRPVYLQPEFIAFCIMVRCKPHLLTLLHDMNKHGSF